MPKLYSNKQWDDAVDGPIRQKDCILCIVSGLGIMSCSWLCEKLSVNLGASVS